MSFRSVLSAITCALFTLHTHGRVNEISKELSANQDNVLVFALGMNPGGELAINLLKHESIHCALYKGDDATPLKQFLPQQNQINYTIAAGDDKAFYRLFAYKSGDAAAANGPLSIHGQVDVVHPYGKLEPSGYKAFVYYRFALLMVTALSVAWFVMMFRYKRSLVGHHYAISAVLLSVACETLLHCVRLSYINDHGSSWRLIEFAAIHVEVLRQTLCRLLVILVSLGWGITTATQEITKKMQDELLKVGLIYYFSASVFTHCLFSATQTHDFGTPWFILPVVGCQALVDTFVSWTVLVNLSDILAELKLTRQYMKHDHYQRFTYALMILIALAAVNVAVESIFMGRQNWFKWFDWIELVRDCVWHGLVLLFTVIVMVAWRPTREAKIYAFVKQLPQFDTNETVDIDFDADGQVIQVAKNEHIIADAVFTIGDDEEMDDPEIETDEIEEFVPLGPDGDAPMYQLDLGGTDTDGDLSTLELGYHPDVNHVLDVVSDF
eukprot:849021_1